MLKKGLHLRSRLDKIPNCSTGHDSGLVIGSGLVAKDALAGRIGWVSMTLF